MSLPLPPAAEIKDIVEGVNELYASSPLPVTEIQVTAATYTVGSSNEFGPSGTIPAYVILLVSTGFQKTILFPATIPVGSRILIKDISGNAGTNMIIVSPQGGLLIDGVSNTFLINVNWGSALFIAASEGMFSVGRYFVQSQYFDSLILFDQSIDSSVTIHAQTNGMSVGPLTISALDSNNQDVVVTVQNGARWVVI
jgi:hypothetical protein